jgi:hypothetical protein
MLKDPIADPTGHNIFQAALREAAYDPNFASSSPINRENHDETLEPDEPEVDPSLLDDDEANKVEIQIQDPPVQYASQLKEYYVESAMKAAQRNELPDSEFGLPRLRKYPLNDEAHVRAAIKMFGHCKDPKDKATLAKRIFAKVNEMNLDVKIGKNSPLYEYAPKSLQESVQEDEDEPAVVIYGMEKRLDARSREDIVKEHLYNNSLFYNSIFYGDDYSKSVKAVASISFLDFFYPSFKTHNFYSRIKTALAGLGVNEDIYEQFGMRYPLCTDFSKPIGWMKDWPEEDFKLAVSMESDTTISWFQTDSTDDLNHVKYCLALYSILGEIMLDPNFKEENLTEMQLGILTDWQQEVSYVYDSLVQCEPGTDLYLYYAQYLHDLFWDCNDNPYDPSCAMTNILSMVKIMPSAKSLLVNINESGEMFTKQDCTAYMTHELGMEDEMFLLPNKLEYPIINQQSVRLAMDLITRIDKDDIPIFTANLNRKYKEMGCSFSITIDHPYAKYADQNIVDHMNRILVEGDTAISDQGTSGANTSIDTEPWYKRVDTVDDTPHNLLDNKELGPNDKKTGSPDYSRHDSVF